MAPGSWQASSLLPAMGCSHICCHIYMLPPYECTPLPCGCTVEICCAHIYLNASELYIIATVLAPCVITDGRGAQFFGLFTLFAYQLSHACTAVAYSKPVKDSNN